MNSEQYVETICKLKTSHSGVHPETNDPVIQHKNTHTHTNCPCKADVGHAATLAHDVQILLLQINFFPKFNIFRMSI